jgi:hypothetical protein
MKVKVQIWVLGFVCHHALCCGMHNVSFIAECWANFDLRKKNKMLNSTNAKEFLVEKNDSNSLDFWKKKEFKSPDFYDKF